MRKLAWAAFGFSAAVFLAHYLLRGAQPYWAAAAALLLLPIGMALRGMNRRRWLLCLAAAAVGFGWYGFAAQRVLAPLAALDGGAERLCHGRVCTFPVQYDYAQGVTLRLYEPGLEHMRTRVYDYSFTLGDLRPGDEITVRLKLRPGTERYGEETDSYLSQGICALGTVLEAPEKTGVWRWSVLYLPQRLSHRMQETAQAVFPADVRAFASALMLGEKRALYQENLDIPLRDAGIMHAVAVSGLHLSFLLGAVTLLFGRRRYLSLLSFPLLGFFVLMAGATPSVLRAAFMMSVFLLAPVLGRESDPATGLLAVLAGLLAARPFSAGSASLQLSFAAMAGIVLLSNPIYLALRRRYSPARKPGRAAHFLYATLSASLSAMVFTLPIGAVRFGTVALAAPITNLLVMSVLPAAFVGSYVSVLLGMVFLPVGRIAGWIMAWLLRYVLLVSKGAAALPGLRLAASSPFAVLWLALAYLIAAVWLLARRFGKAPGPVVPVCCVLTALLLCGMLTRAAGESEARFTAIDVGQGQSLLFRAGRASILVDCGGSHTVENAGDLAARALLEEGRERLDALILTHPHEDHVNGAERLLLQVRVAHLILPAAADPASDALRPILETARRRGTQIHRLAHDTVLSLPGLEAELFVALGRSHEDGCMMLRVTHADFDVLVTGDVTAAVEGMLAQQYDLAGTEVLVAGHHGSRFASGDALLSALGARLAVVSCGYNNYGHPTQETLDRLARYGLSVLRTDRDGTVTIRMEG